MARSLLVLLAMAGPALGAGRVGHLLLHGSPAGGHAEGIAFTWRFGDRALPLRGVRVPPGGRLEFTLTPKTGKLLTLELREFRTADGQSPAYTVSVGGEIVAFRCRHYDGTGPASAFLDLPDQSPGRPCAFTVTNVADTPLQLSEVSLYEDLEAHVRSLGLLQPMHLGPTVESDVTAARLREIRGILAGLDDLRPMAAVHTFALAQWAPEAIHERLLALIAAAEAAGVPVELQLNTWWAGTPFGPDGQGGRWCDPEYQQVTYDADLGAFGLSIPNHWSSVPWLTTRNARLNAFKAGRFALVGRLLREAWTDFHWRRAGETVVFPVRSVVLDNEPAYWGAGNPGTSPHLQADFNPAMAAAARAEGVTLDPRDGLSDAEMTFLRRSLRAYNREMAAGFLRGLGRCPLADQTYTHTFMGGWGFDNPVQATEAGVLQDLRLGGEWGERGSSSDALSWLDIHRELGVPADINCELGGERDGAGPVQLAYAAGCDHISLFNLSDEGLRNTAAAVQRGWGELPPVPWRPRVWYEDFQNDGWRGRFGGEGVEVDYIWPLPDRALYPSEVGQVSRARFSVRARDLVGTERFERLALAYRARAFVFQEMDDRAYLAIRAGADRDHLREVDRLTNGGGQYQVDLTSVAQGQTELTIEFEMHALGLAGWVCVFDCALEVPWAEEALLHCNRSYRADRLRAESLLAGWRADAVWALQRLEAANGADVARARARFQAGDYRAATELAHEALLERAPDTYQPWEPPPPNREEAGEARGLVGDTLRFEPYDDGGMGRAMPVAADCAVTLQVNDGAPASVTGDQVSAGDDVTLTVRDGIVVRVNARRCEVLGRVQCFEAATPFRLARLKVEGAPLLPIDSLCLPAGRVAPEKPASCPLVVGRQDFRPGDRVYVRWNPARGRIVEARLVP
ncbi:MAG: hypothetical protein HPY69_03430 [Armatimonadetes bacterium]|nr:hypothetical protein [Armatimonadota bacterium]